jgi:hypothetical protein
MGIPIRMANERFIPRFSIEIWPVLFDIARYPNWWPRLLFVHLSHANPGLVGPEFSYVLMVGDHSAAKWYPLRNPYVFVCNTMGIIWEDLPNGGSCPSIIERG